MNPVIAIVSDDLTGSGDTAVQFVRAGWSTLSIGGADEALAGDGQAEVLAVTTHVAPCPPIRPPDRARQRRALTGRRQAPVQEGRFHAAGPFLAEIEAACAAWAPDAIAVICPAFPATGRTVSGGVLW